MLIRTVVVAPADCSHWLTDSAFLSFLSEMKHMADEHPRVRCCNLIMFKDELDKHYLNSGNHPHCEECFIGFESQTKLDEHKASKHAHPELRCGICDIPFASSAELDLHNSDPGIHSMCGICYKVFKDVQTKVEHYAETHTATKSKTEVYQHPHSGPSGTLSSEEASEAGPWRALAQLASSVSRTRDTCYPTHTLRSVWPWTQTSAPHAAQSLPSSSNVFASGLAGRSARTISHVPEGVSGISRMRLGSISGFDLSDRDGARTFSLTSSNSTLSGDNTSNRSPDGEMTNGTMSESSTSNVPLWYRRATTNSSNRNGTPPPPHLMTSSPSSSSVHTPTQSHPLSPSEPSSSRSRLSIAETPSGDLSNFNLLNGSASGSPTNAKEGGWRQREIKRMETLLGEAREMDVFSTSSPSPPAVPSTPLAIISPFMRAVSSTTQPLRSSSSNATTRSQFYCRSCTLDPCEEITATACGHLFCNRCIVKEVRENARCPICNAAILLFALLKLDLRA
ncbi:hypothetical protein EW146_g6959 [Bondarzewia mesenterica]|uniref:RING-type domain-containing protein n=1 Tax=Bondarzewia mesenterica TaxID=1095465 RepID=A0A4V3XED4_9AGAM|nr:hypothetical protein EW146_g6959 [Bondarzewia mesenterica]